MLIIRLPEYEMALFNPSASAGELESAVRQARTVEALGLIAIHDGLENAPSSNHIAWLDYVGNELSERLDSLRSTQSQPEGKFATLIGRLTLDNDNHTFLVH